MGGSTQKGISLCCDGASVSLCSFIHWQEFHGTSILAVSVSLDS